MDEVLLYDPANPGAQKWQIGEPHDGMGGGYGSGVRCLIFPLTPTHTLVAASILDKIQA